MWRNWDLRHPTPTLSYSEDGSGKSIRHLGFLLNLGLQTDDGWFYYQVDETMILQFCPTVSLVGGGNQFATTFGAHRSRALPKTLVESWWRPNHTRVTDPDQKIDLRPVCLFYLFIYFVNVVSARICILVTRGPWLYKQDKLGSQCKKSIEQWWN